MEQVLEHRKLENGFYGNIEDKPVTERKLFALQEEFFKRRNEYKEKLLKWQEKSELAFKKHKDFKEPPPVDTSSETWGEMFKELYVYVQSCVKQRLKNKKYIPPEEIEDKAATITCVFLQQYNYNPEFFVGASFAGMFKWKIVEVLYGNGEKEEDRCASLDAFIGDSNTHIGDTLNTDYFLTPAYNNLNPEDLINDKDTLSIVDEVFEELDEVLGKDSVLAFKARLYFNMWLLSPKTRHSKRLFKERWAPDYQTEQVVESVILELYKRCKAMVYKD